MAGGQKRTVEVDKLSEAELRSLVPTLLQQLSSQKQRIAELTRMIFGRKSEKSRYAGDATSLLPFAELAELRSELETAEAAANTVTVPEHERAVNKRRKDFPDHLPRRRTEFALGEEDWLS